MKLDLHTLVKRGLDCDDVLPDELRPIWVFHFEMMREIGKVKFQGAMVPEDEINLDIQTTDVADASQKLACGNIRKIFEERWYSFMSAYLL